MSRSFLVEREVVEEDSFGEARTFKYYQITPEGIEWLRSHKELLVVQNQPMAASSEDDEDDIPF